MKINSVKNAGPVKSSLSVDAIDDENDKKQFSIPVPGYKRKHAKLVYKYNMFVQKYQQKHDEGFPALFIRAHCLPPHIGLP